MNADHEEQADLGARSDDAAVRAIAATEPDPVENSAAG
jgi:hypothetical protein